MSLLYFFFIVLTVFAIASALVTILSRNPLRSAFALVVHFLMLAGLYLTLNAQFIAIIQVLVYGGAIMVLVIFVIMLLNLAREESLAEKFDYRRLLAVALGVAFVLQFTIAFFSSKNLNSNISSDSVRIGTASEIGKALFTNYLVPFEIIGILLLSAIIGAIVLAKRKVE
ncbi:MAG: NADH-quinone oxidoreductase subunit J [Ignavibacteria bacterium]|nr:NADH-quinone oxidoreductase subunit J [Ignavibacteria bacterium]